MTTISVQAAIPRVEVVCLMLKQTAPLSRRRDSRIKTPDGVWVILNCGGRDETSQVRDLSLGGLFVHATSPRPIGAKAYLEFLVQEGQIRAEAVVRHIEANRGLGLKFTAVNDKDRPRLVGLINRARSLSQ